MNEDVNSKRRYTSPRRAMQAVATRESIISAAKEAFISQGWQKATLAGIARQAGVSSESVYAIFGNKRTLLESVVAGALRGASPHTPLLEQKGPQAIAAAADQASQLKLFARDITEVLGRVAPIMAVVRAAAEADNSLIGLYRSLHASRRKNLEFVIDALLKHGPLKADLSRQDAVDTLWRLVSPELLLLVTGVEGLPPESYEAWLMQTLPHALLD